MIHRCGAVEIDEARREVRRAGLAVPCSAKVFDTLVHLVRHADRIVPHGELRDHLWPGGAVSDGALGVCVYRARALLRGAGTIRAVRGRGFRYLAADGATRDAPPSRRRLDPQARLPLVGRESEGAALAALVDELLSGRGGVAVIAGEPGIGKSRLARALVEDAQAAGALVLSADCQEHDAALSSWRQILAALRRQRPARAAGAAASRAAQQLEALLAGRARGRAAGSGDAEHRGRLRHALTTCLAALAVQSPLLLLFDDLQWADASSLSLLRSAVDELRDEPIAWVALHRDLPAADAASDLAALLGALQRWPGVHRVTLGALPDQDARLLLRARAGDALDAATADAILARAEGNPFFLLECWRHLQTGRGVAGNGAAPLPNTIGAVMNLRLAALSPVCRDVVGVAAVLGREADYDLLSAVCGIGEAALLDALDEAWQQRIVVVPATAGRVRFVHALLHTAAYQRLAEPERRRCHCLVAEAIERLYADDLEPHFAALAHHCLQAGADGDPERAIAYATRAGEQAGFASAFEQAARHFEQALRCLDTYRPQLSAHRRGLELALANALDLSGERVRAAAVYGASLLRPQPAAVSQQRLLQRFDFSLHVRDESLAGESRGSAQRWRAEHARDAVARARRAGDVDGLTLALAERRWATTGPSFFAERLRISTDYVEAAEQLGQVDYIQEARLFRISDLLERGRIDAVDAALSAYARLTERHPEPVYRWILTYLGAMRAQLAGHLDEAEDLAAQALQLGAPLGSFAPLLYSTQLAAIRASQGRMVELAPGIEAAAAQFPRVVVVQVARLCSLCLQGRLDEARAALDSLAADDFAAIETHPAVWINAVLGLVDACRVLEDGRRAALLYDKLLPLSGSCAVSGFAFAYLGSIDMYLGVLAMTGRRPKVAIRHFEAALRSERRMRARAGEAHVQYLLGRALLACGGGERRARELLKTAATTAGALALPGLAAQIESLR